MCVCVHMRLWHFSVKHHVAYIICQLFLLWVEFRNLINSQLTQIYWINSNSQLTINGLTRELKLIWINACPTLLTLHWSNLKLWFFCNLWLFLSSSLFFKVGWVAQNALFGLCLYHSGNCKNCPSCEQKAIYCSYSLHGVIIVVI